jgi:hypothetical protein
MTETLAIEPDSLTIEAARAHDEEKVRVRLAGLASAAIAKSRGAADSRQVTEQIDRVTRKLIDAPDRLLGKTMRIKTRMPTSKTGSDGRGLNPPPGFPQPDEFDARDRSA